MSNELQITNPGGAVQKSPNVDLETIKSIYYWLNAKPDTNIKLLGEPKRINLGDIYAINSRVNEKLENHNVQNYLATIIITLSNGKIREYGSWAEFERERWESINDNVKAISINWDLTIKLPKFELPQRHTLKLRIGTEMAPKDAFQMMFSSDDINEIKQIMVYGICKVDFINQVLSNELLNLVDNWYDGLPKVEEKGYVQNIIEKYKSFLLGSIVNFSPVFFFYLFYVFTDLCAEHLNWDTSLNMLSLQKLILVGLLVFTTGIMLGKVFARGIERKIMSFKDYSGFVITKGDKNFNDSIKKKNKKITQVIFGRMILGAASGGTAVIVKLLLEKIIN